MRKLFAIAFTCVYLTLTVGVVHTTHYCMGRVNSTSLFSFDAKRCGCELFASEANESCCKDDHTLIKIDDDQSISTSVSIAPEFYSMGEFYFQKTDETTTETGLTFLTTHDKPPCEEVPLFVKHCALILYSDSDLA